MEVEFFHSVMCGHCFIMSNRIRRIVQKYPEINIIHRGYPLRWDDTHDKEKFKDEIDLKRDFRRKWTTANNIDDNHRFNMEGFEEMDFPMPTSRLPMIAIQAGTLAGGDEWALFDRFQSALYEDIRNISDEDVIADIIVEAGIDFNEFLKYYEDPDTEKMIKADFLRAEEYGLELIPAMVVEGKHMIVGTKRYDLAVELLKEAAKKEGIEL